MSNLLKTQNIADQIYSLGLLNRWAESSDNEELKELRDAYARQLAYVTTLETERYAFEALRAKLSEERIQAIYRAREAEELCLKAAERIEKLEKSLKAFTG